MKRSKKNHNRINNGIIRAEALEKLMRFYNHARKVSLKSREAVKAIDGGLADLNGHVRCCGVYVNRVRADKYAHGFAMRQEGIYMALKAFGFEVVKRGAEFVAVPKSVINATLARRAQDRRGGADRARDRRAQDRRTQGEE